MLQVPDSHESQLFPDLAFLLANLTEFRKLLEREWGVSLPDYGAVWRFSIEHMDKFWHSVWEYGRIIAPTRGERTLTNGGSGSANIAGSSS